MASLLIIGGTGFFGKSILDAYSRGLLNQWGIDSVSVLARNAQKLKIQCPELIHHSVNLINSDIGNCNEVPFADYVIHAAASTDASNYISQPELEKNNIQAAIFNYCALAKKYHRNSRIIYCSSGAVYGQQPAEVEYMSEEFEGGNINEMPAFKRNYALAKRDAEKAILELGGDGLKVSIARCFAFIGKYLPRDQHFAIGNFIEDGLQGRPINIKATTSVIRSYMYADDLVCWLMTIFQVANPFCPTYNVGSDRAITIVDLADLVSKRFGAEVNRAELDRGSIDRYIPSIDKAKKDLDLNQPMDLSAAIDKTIAAISLKKMNA